MKHPFRYITAVKIGILFIAAYALGHFGAMAANHFIPRLLPPLPTETGG